MFDGAGAGNGAVCRNGRAGRGDYRARLGGGDGSGGRRAGGGGVREAEAGASAVGAGSAGRFGDSRCAGPGRKSDCDGSGADYRELLKEIWSKGPSGIFVGRDGSESAAVGGCDCGGYGDGVFAAGEPTARGGYGAGVGDGVYHEPESSGEFDEAGEGREFDFDAARRDCGGEQSGIVVECAPERFGRSAGRAAGAEETDNFGAERSGLGGDQYDYRRGCGAADSAETESGEGGRDCGISAE